jgi:hypothetical protein
LHVNCTPSAVSPSSFLSFVRWPFKRLNFTKKFLFFQEAKLAHHVEHKRKKSDSKCSLTLNWPVFDLNFREKPQI